jgi:hypothetical protein
MARHDGEPYRTDELYDRVEALEKRTDRLDQENQRLRECIAFIVDTVRRDVPPSDELQETFLKYADAYIGSRTSGAPMPREECMSPAEWDAIHGAIHGAKHDDGVSRREALPPSTALNICIVTDEERELWKAAYCSALTGAAIHGSFVGITNNAAVFAELAVEDFRKKFRQP